MSSPKLKENKSSKVVKISTKKTETSKKQVEGADKKKNTNHSPPLSTSKLTRKTENALNPKISPTKIAKDEKNRSPPVSTPKLKSVLKKNEKILSDVTMEVASKIKVADRRSENVLKKSEANVAPLKNSTYQLICEIPLAELFEKKANFIPQSFSAMVENPDSTNHALKNKKNTENQKTLVSRSLDTALLLSSSSSYMLKPTYRKGKRVNRKPAAKNLFKVLKSASSLMESEEEEASKENRGFLNSEKKGKRTVFLMPGLTRPITRKAPCLDLSKLKVINPISNIWKNNKPRWKIATSEKIGNLSSGRVKSKLPKKKTPNSRSKKEGITLTKSAGHHSRFKRLTSNKRKSFVSKGTNMHTLMVYDRRIRKHSRLAITDNKFRNVACSNGDLRATKDASTHADFDIEKYIDDFLRKNKAIIHRRKYMKITSDEETM